MDCRLPFTSAGEYPLTLQAGCAQQAASRLPRLRQVSAGQVGDVCAHETWRSISCNRKLSEAQSELESVLRRFCRLLSESASLVRDSDKIQVSEYAVRCDSFLSVIFFLCACSSCIPSCISGQRASTHPSVPTAAMQHKQLSGDTAADGKHPRQDSTLQPHRIHHKAA